MNTTKDEIKSTASTSDDQNANEVNIDRKKFLKLEFTEFNDFAFSQMKDLRINFSKDLGHVRRSIFKFEQLYSIFQENSERERRHSSPHGSHRGKMPQRSHHNSKRYDYPSVVERSKMKRELPKSRRPNIQRHPYQGDMQTFHTSRKK